MVVVVAASPPPSNNVGGEDTQLSVSFPSDPWVLILLLCMLSDIILRLYIRSIISTIHSCCGCCCVVVTFSILVFLISFTLATSSYGCRQLRVSLACLACQCCCMYRHNDKTFTSAALLPLLLCCCTSVGIPFLPFAPRSI